MGIEAPPRAQYIRTILSELSPHRQRSSCSSARWACRSARSRPAFYGFRDREYVLNLIEAATGGRFHPNFDRIGGLKDDLPVGLDRRDARPSMKTVLDVCDEFEDLVVGNEIFEARTRGDRHHPGRARRRLRRVGRQPARRRASTGTSAATARRTSSYNELDWKVWTHPDGDSFARYWVRLQETRESARMVLQLLDEHAERADHGEGPAHHQGARGRGVGRTPRTRSARWATTSSRKGATGPFRVKIRSASFSNVSILPWLLRGVYVPDVITILASLYFILGDIDR